MLTRPQLESSFNIYFKEIDRCVAGRSGWALLHLLVALPDVCAALESNDSISTADRYRDWCERFLTNPLLSPEERYDLRCVLLHQGRTIPRRGRYERYFFTQPDERGLSGHLTMPRGTLLLDVNRLADELVQSIRTWFDNLEQGKDPARSRNVEQNLQSLATVQQLTVGPSTNPLFRMDTSGSP